MDRWCRQSRLIPPSPHANHRVLLGEDHRNRPEHHDRILFGDMTFLFTGDAEVANEAAMVRRGHTLNAQILQLGHHGSRTSSSSAFLRAVQPELAIWSAGKGNSYGHPHAEVLTRLKVMGVTVCGTVAYGTITVRTDGQRYAVDNGECMQTERLAASTPTPARAAGGTGAVSAPAVATNTASFEEVGRIEHIGPDRAADLICLRPYTSVDQLERINGIGPARIRDIKAQGIACAH